MPKHDFPANATALPSRYRTNPPPITAPADELDALAREMNALMRAFDARIKALQQKETGR